MNPVSSFLSPASCLLYRVSQTPSLKYCLLHPVSCNLSLTSCLLHRVSYILSLTSRLLHPVCCIVSHTLHLTFCLLHLNPIVSCPSEISFLSKTEGFCALSATLYSNRTQHTGNWRCLHPQVRARADTTHFNVAGQTLTLSSVQVIR